MGDEVDLRQNLMARVAQQVVERGAAGRALQAVDAAEAAVVVDDDDQLAAEHQRGGDLGVHHQIGAVADDDDHFALRQRQLDADAAGDLVAHAGIAVFDVIAERRARLPELVQFAGQPAGGADDDVVSIARALQGAEHLRVARRRRVGGGAIALGDWKAPDSWREAATAAKGEWMKTAARYTARTNLELPSDAQVLGAVNRAAAPRDVVVCAAGGLPGELHKLWRCREAGTYHLEYGYSCMGYEIAGGLGVKL
ncbi:MAG: hypothetical protein JO107_03730, partial [Hyphomicrobiales bacterium]|nr:hypothetical protein [Hyphomicrobiales bacterium]